MAIKLQKPSKSSLFYPDENAVLTFNDAQSRMDIGTKELHVIYVEAEDQDDIISDVSEYMQELQNVPTHLIVVSILSSQNNDDTKVANVKYDLRSHLKLQHFASSVLTIPELFKTLKVRPNL